MPEKKKTHFSLSGALSGYLGALFGAEFSLYLSSSEFSKKRKLSFKPENFSFEQQKIINLIQIMERSSAEGKMENVKRYGLLLVAVLKDLFGQKIPVKYRHMYFSGILYHLFVQLGDDLSSRGLAAEALLFYQELLTFYPQDIFLLKKAARAYYSRGVFFLPQAEQLYRQILELAPEDLEVYEALGHLLENFPGREEEAFSVYREALRQCRTDMDKIRFYLCLLALSPHDYELLLRLGRLCRRQGMLIESRYYLEEAFNRRQDAWTALELGRVCCLLNDLHRAGKAAAALYSTKESFPTAHYLLGLIDEGEEKWAEARDNYLQIPPGAPLYWEARAGVARTLLNEGKYSEAEELVMSIPAGPRNTFEAEYLDLCALLERAAGEQHRYSSWREYLREIEPLYELKKDIRKRNMGPAFWRKYEFLEVYGKGPAGQVLLGRERNGGRKVAIKQIDERFTADPVSIRRLQGLLKTIRSFSTPYIVSVYEDCWYNNRFFFAMEYIEGGSLAEFIRLRAPLPLTEAFAIALQVCSALDYLYSRNRAMSHGALKPENILLSADRSVKITDFDILWVLEGTKVFSDDILKKYRSFPGVFQYAAPERFDSRGFWGGRRKSRTRSDTLEAAVQGVDHRADLYSLGVILFELLTGILPFKKDSVESVIRFQRSHKSWPSPRLFNPSLSAEMEEIILRLLRRNPSDRYATPAELRAVIKKAKIL